jgi:hypothetical protein
MGTIGFKPRIPPSRVFKKRKFLEITTFPRTLSSTFWKNTFSFFRVFSAWIYAAFASFSHTATRRRAPFKELSLKFLQQQGVSTLLSYIIYPFFIPLSSVFWKNVYKKLTN